MSEPTFDPSRTALWLMDVQPAIVAMEPDAGALLDRLVTARDAARQAGVAVEAKGIDHLVLADVVTVEAFTRLLAGG